MSSKISTEKYDIVKMERLKHFLENHAERGKSRFYEIFVDNLKVVDKTNDPACFDDYTTYISDDSRMVKILIYTGNEASPRNDKFIYTLGDPEEEKRKEELNGLDIQHKIDSAISAERERLNTKKLKEELEAKTKQLTEADEYIEQLRQALEAEKARKYNPRELQFGNIAAIALEEVINRNPAWIKKVPLLGALTGFINEEQPADRSLSGAAANPPGSSGQPVTEESKASFSKKQPEPTPLDKEAQVKLSFFSQMEAAFTEEQLTQVVEIIEQLICQPVQVQVVHELLHTPPMQPEKEETEEQTEVEKEAA